MKKTMTHITGLATALFTGFTACSGTALAQSSDTMAATPPPMNIMDMAWNMECPTNNGGAVSVMNMSAAGLYSMFHSRFGYADYAEGMGYRTFIDAASLQNASPQLQTFIVAHECAHHTLGHSYEAYDNGFVSQDRHHRYERQADCEALNHIAHEFGYRGRAVVSAIFDEFEQVNQDIILALPIDAEEQADLLNSLPGRSAARKADGLRCPMY